MRSKGITDASIDKAAPLFDLKGSNADRLEALRSYLRDSKIGTQGIAELEKIIITIGEVGLQSIDCNLALTLARGLNYYTGTIFEVAAPREAHMGSIGGGGRYDDLTGIFGLKDVSGVGISFGLDRIYLVLEEMGLFPKDVEQSLQVLCVNFGEKEALAALKLVSNLRQRGISADLYPTSAKMQKQFKYAHNIQVPYVVSIGEHELEAGVFVVKNMASGEERTYSTDDFDQFMASL
jgi:histidyl-tRNA synthetase